MKRITLFIIAVLAISQASITIEPNIIIDQSNNTGIATVWITNANVDIAGIHLGLYDTENFNPITITNVYGEILENLNWLTGWNENEIMTVMLNPNTQFPTGNNLLINIEFQVEDAACVVLMPNLEMPAFVSMQSFNLITDYIFINDENCELISGCTDLSAQNYNDIALYNNGTCEYAPIIEHIPNQWLTPSEPLLIELNASDEDDDELTYSINDNGLLSILLDSNVLIIDTSQLNWGFTEVTVYVSDDTYQDQVTFSIMENMEYETSYGDVNNDGIVNVSDIVTTISIISGQLTMTEQADINSDGIVNIIDVVLLVEIVLGYNPGRLSPSIIDLLLEEGSLNTKASGIAGFRLTTNVEDFEITNHPDNWILTQYDNQLIMINLDGSESAGKLFEYSGKIEIEDVFLIGWNGVQIETNIITVPNDFELFPAYPNPFNPQTTIDFELASDSNVKISIYNLSGREIETLENGTRQSGYYSMTWDASSQATGVYLVRMTVDNFTTTQKVMLVK